MTTNHFYVKREAAIDDRDVGRCEKCNQGMGEIIFNTPYHTVCLCPKCFNEFLRNLNNFVKLEDKLGIK